MENWRKFVNEQEYKSRWDHEEGWIEDVPQMTKPRDGYTRLQPKWQEPEGLDVQTMRDLGKDDTGPIDAFFDLWNNTAGEILFKFPGTPGAETYTAADLGVDIILTAIGLKIGAKLVPKIANRLYKMNNTRRRISSAEGLLVILTKRPSLIQTLLGAAAFEIGQEALIEPEIKIVLDDLIAEINQSPEVELSAEAATLIKRATAMEGPAMGPSSKER